jgi:hypothetical protein
VALLCFIAMVMGLADQQYVAAPTLAKRGDGTPSNGLGFVLVSYRLFAPDGTGRRHADRYSPKWVPAFRRLVVTLTAFTRRPDTDRNGDWGSPVGLGQSGVIPASAFWCAGFRHEYRAPFSAGVERRRDLAFPRASAVLNFWGWHAVFRICHPRRALASFDHWGHRQSCSLAVSARRSWRTLGASDLPRVVRVPWKAILVLPPIYAVMTLHFSFN